MSKQANIRDKMKQTIPAQGPTSSLKENEKLSEIFCEANQLIQKTDLFNIKKELSCWNDPHSSLHSKWKTKKDVSVIMDPYMFLTTEEKKTLDELLRKQLAACNKCCPVRLCQK